MTTLRRFVALSSLLFWQGGFTFYAAVVIPIAGRVLHDNLHLRARITDQTTNVLNYAGVVAVALLLWDLAAAADSSRLRQWLRGGSWAVLLLTLVALFALHYWMDLLNPPAGSGPPPDPATFFLVHSAYIWISTAQWLAALVWLVVGLRTWRAQDSLAPDHGGVSPFMAGSNAWWAKADGKESGDVGVKEGGRGISDKRDEIS